MQVKSGSNGDGAGTRRETSPVTSTALTRHVLTPRTDFFALDSKYHPPISTRGALVMAMIIGVAYGFWTEYAAYHNDGMFPYPFLTQMAEDERIWVYLGGSALAVVVFWILNALHK